MSYLTIQEAIEISGKSESTIRRFVRKMNSLGSKGVKKEVLANGGHRFLIQESVLKKAFKSASNPVVNNKKEPNTGNEKVILKNHSDMDVAMQYIRTLEQQLQVKDQQIHARDKQITEFLEQEREHVMLLDRINQALIQLRIPGSFGHMVVDVSDQEEEERVERKGSEEKKSKPKVKDTKDKTNQKSKAKKVISDKARFNDWLESLT